MHFMQCKAYFYAYLYIGKEYKEMYKREVILMSITSSYLLATREH